MKVDGMVPKGRQCSLSIALVLFHGRVNNSLVRQAWRKRFCPPSHLPEPAPESSSKRRWTQVQCQVREEGKKVNSDIQEVSHTWNFIKLVHQVKPNM